MKQILQKMKQYVLVVLLVLMGNYGWGQTYSQVTTIGGLVDGNYLIVGDGSADGLMLNTITTGTNPYINYNTISNPGANISTGYNASNVFQINVLSGVVTIFNSSVGYVSWGRTGVTGNAANFFNGTIANTERWTATVASGLWTLRNESDSNRILQWNPGSPRFACYTTNQTKLKLYRINNTAPTASSVTFSGTNTIGQTLTGTYTYADAESDLEGTSTFQWYRADNASGLNSAAISGETNPSYTLQAADNGKYIRLGVIPVAQTGTSPGVEAFSSWQGPVTDPSAVTISVVETITPFANTCVNQFSSSQSYTVSASNLTENITITAPTHFEISTDDATWTTSIVLTPTSGTVGATTLYVRFTPTAVGAQSGNLSHVSAGATTQNIALNGEGINSSPTVTTPTSTLITVSSAVLGGDLTVVGCTSVTTRGIEYSTTPGFSNGSGTVVSESGTFSTGTFTVNVTGLTSGTTYYYKAFATSASGTSYTTEASFSTLAIAAPLALNATGVGATSFTATWDAVAGATGYEIDVYESNLSSNSTTETFTSIGGGSSTSYSTRAWTGNNNITWTAYNSRTDQVIFSGNDALTLRDASGSYLESGEITGNPTNITFDLKQSFTGSGGAVTLSILHGASFGTTTQIGVYPYTTSTQNIVAPISGITGPFKVVLSNNAAARPTIDNLAITKLTESISYILQNQNVGNVTSYPITGLDQNTTYYYVVRALDATSESVNSNEITTTTALVSTTWNGTTWSNGAPTSTVDAIIDGDFSTAGNFICKDLTLNSGKTLTINAADKLSVMEDLVNNGSIVFKSNATSTGRFDSYNGAAIAGSGTVTMERYIDGKRAYRLLAPGVTTAGTIANNWQQQVFITGSTTGADGFDATTTGNPSMYTYENTGWAPITNTNILTLDATKGYRMLIRGDRTPSILTSPSNGTMNTPVTLSATGTMVTGEVTFNTLPNQNYTLVANPYISPIDWATVTKTGISDTYYAWDPNLGTGNQRGRYVSCDVLGATSIISDNGSQNTAVDQYIQPGQAFFIEKAVSGTPGSVTVKETDKAATFTDVFRTNSAPTITTIEGKLGMNLYESLAYSLGDYPIDGAVAVSGTAFNTASANDDAKKLMSHGEQVAFVRENKQLGVEKVSPPQLNDVLTLATLNLVPNKNYVWSVVLQDNFSNENSYLYDAFTQTYHSLTASGTTVVSFATTADVTSTQANRFKIVFQTSVLSTPDFTNEIVVYPNPAKAQNAVCYVKGISNATVALHNVLGQNIPIQTTTDGTTLTLRPTVALNKGVYIVHIAQDGTIKQVKWIVD